MTCRLSIVKQDIVHNSMPISMPTTWVVTTGSGIGEEDPDIFVALSHRRRPPAHTGAPTGTHFNGENRPVRTSENSYRIGSLPGPCQVLQQAPLSLSVLMDGEQSTEARSLSVSKCAACYDKGSPVASTSIADAIFLRCPRRVAGRHYCLQAPSERHVPVSEH